jgi:integrase
VSLGAIKANPFLETKARRVPKKRKVALNHNELDILLTQAKIRRHPYYYVWLLTVSLGLRRSELAGLKWTDVDFDMGVIHLTRQIIAREGLVPHLKDKEDRSVAIPDYLIPVLKEMKLKATSEFVIELNCESWTMGRQAQVLREFCVEIGIKEVTHRQLRSTHITLALIDGVPLGIVKENVGHTKLSTTDEYFCSSGIQMAGQMNKLRIQIPSDQLATVHAIKPAT